MIGELPSPSSPAEDAGPDWFHPDSPSRPLDWRWRLAGRLASGEPSRRRTPPDAWVRRASRYVSRSLGNREGCRGRGRKLDDRTIGAALGLRRGVLHCAPPAIDLMLLAGLDDLAIAARTGIGQEAVAAYAALLCDVRPLLPHADAVLIRAIGPRAHDADGGGPAVALALLAYHGGPFVLDELLGPDFVGVDARLAALMAGTASDPIAEQFGLLVAARALPTHGREALHSLRLLAKAAGVTPVEPSSGSAGAGVDLAGMFGDLAGLDPAATARRMDAATQRSQAPLESDEARAGKAATAPSSSGQGRAAPETLQATG